MCVHCEMISQVSKGIHHSAVTILCMCVRLCTWQDLTSVFSAEHMCGTVDIPVMLTIVISPESFRVASETRCHSAGIVPFCH